MYGTFVGDILPQIPLDQWTNNFVAWITTNIPGPFNFIKAVLGALVDFIQNLLTGPPEGVVLAILTALALYFAGWRIGLFTLVGLLLLDGLRLWQPAMLTLSLVISATIVSLVLGIPTGIASAQSTRVQAATRPILDVMQTMPSFVYLIPMVVLFGLGNVPALIATVIFSMPPAIRLTMLGIQQVPRETVEAAHAFGATPAQTLIKVELPLALPTIMAGVNQVIMLSLSMVVIAALIGAGGLGAVVVTALSQLNVGEGFVGGVGIVIIAMILDRVTRNAKVRKPKGVRMGDVGNLLAVNVFGRGKRRPKGVRV
jgi:glycine betaine/proline transport system permease protein